MKDGWYWFRSDDAAIRLLYGNKDGWEMVEIVYRRQGIMATVRRHDRVTYHISNDLPGRYEGPIESPSEPHKYDNQDPRCTHVDWPLPEWDWSWMRCRVTPRAKLQVWLVEVVLRPDGFYVKPFDDRNCYLESMVREWKAQFVRAEPPPKEWRP